MSLTSIWPYPSFRGEQILVKCVLAGTTGEITGVPSAEYYLKQAQLAAQFALAESDPEKAQAMHVLALEQYDKADRARVEDTPPAYQLPNAEGDEGLER